MGKVIDANLKIGNYYLLKDMSEAKDEWITYPKDALSTQQKRYFFKVGAARDDVKNDGKIQVNWSKVPKKKKIDAKTGKAAVSV